MPFFVYIKIYGIEGTSRYRITPVVLGGERVDFHSGLRYGPHFVIADKGPNYRV